MTSPIAVARRYLFVREVGGPNRGAFVEAFQRFTHGQQGDSWCADFASLVLDYAYHGKPPLRPTGSTQQMLSEARQRGYLFVTQPQPNDLYFFVHPDGTPHHVGFITSVEGQLIGIAGNTSPDGSSSDGTGVFEHAIPRDPAQVVFVRLPAPTMQTLLGDEA